MQWLIALIIEAIGIPPVFIDRGDPAVFDFTQADFTMDAAWHDLDLSGIVPADASAVLFLLRMKDNLIGSNIRFRKKGNVNFGNTSLIYNQVANIHISVDCVCPIDENRFIQYFGGPVGIDEINFIVKGWWL